MEFKLKADDSCNVWSFGGVSELKWNSASISANSWKYLYEPEEGEEGDEPSNDFDDFHAKL